MKRVRTLFCMLLVLCLMASIGPVQAAANTVASGTCGDSQTWKLDENGVLTISGTGNMADFGYYAPWYDMRMDVQSIIVEDGVESISPWAFFYCQNVTEITLPDSVSDIGMAAFRHCSSLEIINLPARLTTIESNLFSGCSSLKVITLPDGITRLGESAFNGCVNLQAIVIPAGVTNLDKWALSGCQRLSEIVFTGNAPIIVGDAFTWICAIAWYPGDNPTWTADVLQNYGGDIYWRPYCSGDHTYTDDGDTVCNVCGAEREVSIASVPMHRMYDPNSGEHFYTGAEAERDFLVSVGWHYEGVGFNFPEEGEPVYRLYEPVYGEHLYTMDQAEVDKLVGWGWRNEGVAFNSAGTDEVPQYRLHNPNAQRGGYHFTGSVEERDFLISIGWINEGIGWYSCEE